MRVKINKAQLAEQREHTHAAIARAARRAGEHKFPNPITIARDEGFKEGIRAAAGFIGEFAKYVDHPYHIGDVVLCKFNLLPKKKVRRKPR